jgi:hypothetical protein
MGLIEIRRMIDFLIDCRVMNRLRVFVYVLTLVI